MCPLQRPHFPELCCPQVMNLRAGRPSETSSHCWVYRGNQAGEGRWLGVAAGGGGDGELAASWGVAKPGGDSIKPHRGISSLLPSPAACRPGCRLSTPSSPRPAQSPSTQGWLSPSPGREWPVGLCQSELNSCTKLGSFCCSCPRPTPTPPLPPLCCESDLGGVRQRVTF